MKNPTGFWDNMALRYDRLNRRYEESNLRCIDTARRFIDQDKRVLDYGCGTGAITADLAASAGQISAIDTSMKMLDIAKKRGLDLHIDNIEFSSTDILSSSLDGRRFDVVLAFNILHYIRNIDEVLGRIRNMLVPNGIIISVTDCMGEKPSVSSSLKKTLMGCGILPYMKYYKTKELEEVLKTHGFDPFESQTLYPKPPNYLVVARKTKP